MSRRALLDTSVLIAQESGRPLDVESVPVTAEAARHWATLRTRLAEEGRTAKINDLWTAAVATANGMDVVSQDDDFDAIESVGGPTVIRV